jgi:hypothetical protein
MAGIGDGFTQGLALGQQWQQAKKQREAEAARMELESKRHAEVLAAQKTLQAEKLQRDAEQADLDRGLRRELSDKDVNSRAATLDKTIAAERERQAALLKARGDENAMDNIGRSISGFNRFVAGQKPPMARVKRPVDPDDPSQGEVSFDVPPGDLAKMNAPKEPAYQSPYAGEIGDAETQLAEQNAQMAGGDNRTGFLNLSSRRDVASEQTQRLVRLKALELQDKVAKGLMTREQASAEAERMKKTYGL